MQHHPAPTAMLRPHIGKTDAIGVEVSLSQSKRFSILPVKWLRDSFSGSKFDVAIAIAKSVEYRGQAAA